MKKRQAAFTLIELILYMALLSIFIGGAVLFAWDIIYGRVKTSAHQEVSENIRLASQRLIHEIRNAEDINSFSAAAISLAMADTNRNPTVFDISGGRLRIGYGSSGNCPSTSPCNLTSNKVTVSTLSFEDLSTVDDLSKNIRFTITLERNNPNNRKEWEKSETLTTTVEIKSN